jgi:hypothetical protein
LVYEVGKMQATSGECPECFYAPRSHAGIVFTSDQRTKIIYAFARWVNNKGKYGSWCSMITAVLS